MGKRARMGGKVNETGMTMRKRGRERGVRGSFDSLRINSEDPVLEKTAMRYKF